ncbi:8161_t:CDS:2, partial [Funneliformis geosporum]
KENQENEKVLEQLMKDDLDSTKSNQTVVIERYEKRLQAKNEQIIKLETKLEEDDPGTFHQAVLREIRLMIRIPANAKKLAKVLIPTHLKQELLSELKEPRPNLAIKQQHQKFLALHADKKGSMITDEEKIMQECSELSNQLCHLTEPINGRHHEDFLPRLLAIIDTVLQLNH